MAGTNHKVWKNIKKTYAKADQKMFKRGLGKNLDLFEKTSAEVEKFVGNAKLSSKEKKKADKMLLGYNKVGKAIDDTINEYRLTVQNRGLGTEGEKVLEGIRTNLKKRRLKVMQRWAAVQQT